MIRFFNHTTFLLLVNLHYMRYAFNQTIVVANFLHFNLIKIKYFNGVWDYSDFEFVKYIFNKYFFCFSLSITLINIVNKVLLN